MSSKLICTQSMQYISVPVAFLKNIQHKCVGIEIYGDAPTARMQARDREKPKGGATHRMCTHGWATALSLQRPTVLQLLIIRVPL